MLTMSIKADGVNVVVNITQSAVTCSKLTTETLEQGVKHVQS